MTVSNSTVIISLIKIGKVDLLKNIYKNIIITDEIKKEITKNDDYYKHEIRSFNNLLNNFFLIKNPEKNKDFGLHKGENSCLALCTETKDNIFLSDDKNARKAAMSLNIKTIGTIGILILNLKNRKINKKEFFKILQKLIKKGFYISTNLFISIEDYVNKNF
jgi:predicted nucleic acid-binding protein